MTAFTINIDDSILLGITATRLTFNASQPATVDDGHGEQIANPALFATDADYLQRRWGVDAAQSYFDNAQAAFRIPTGDWLQRWTPAEKKQVRAIGAGLVAGVDPATVAQVQAWLDQLDTNPYVNLGDAVVAQGVPKVCALLHAMGIVTDATARAAEIMALDI